MHGLSDLAALLYGVGGGVLPELLALYRRRHRPQTPEWFKSIWFWIPTLLMIAVGGGIAVAYAHSGVHLNPILAINVGASAPLILGTLSREAPDISPGRVG